MTGPLIAFASGMVVGIVLTIIVLSVIDYIEKE